MQRSLLGVAVAAALIGSGAGAASADQDGGNTTANVQVDLAITMTGVTPSFTLVGMPGATVTETEAVSFNVETNNLAGYGVTVEAAGSTLTPAAPGNTDSIPIAALKVSPGAGNWSDIAATPVSVHSQATRSAAGGDNLSNDFKMLIPFVNADTYSVTLNYVATTL